MYKIKIIIQLIFEFDYEEEITLMDKLIFQLPPACMQYKMQQMCMITK